MNNIKFSCPHCHRHLDAPKELFGECVSCPSCTRQIQIPNPQNITDPPSRLSRPSTSTMTPLTVANKSLFMRLNCLLGFHNWDGSTCTRCGKAHTYICPACKKAAIVHEKKLWCPNCNDWAKKKLKAIKPAATARPDLSDLTRLRKLGTRTRHDSRAFISGVMELGFIFVEETRWGALVFSKGEDQLIVSARSTGILNAQYRCEAKNRNFDIILNGSPFQPSL